LVTLKAESNSTTTGQTDILTANTTSTGPIVILINGTVQVKGVKSATFDAGLLSSGEHVIQSCDISTLPAVCSIPQSINVLTRATTTATPPQQLVSNNKSLSGGLGNVSTSEEEFGVYIVILAAVAGIAYYLFCLRGRTKKSNDQ
jgi:hypothetical protein